MSVRVLFLAIKRFRIRALTIHFALSTVFLAYLSPSPAFKPSFLGVVFFHSTALKSVNGFLQSPLFLLPELNCLIEDFIHRPAAKLTKVFHTFASVTHSAIRILLARYWQSLVFELKWLLLLRVLALSTAAS